MRPIALLANLIAVLLLAGLALGAEHEDPAPPGGRLNELQVIGSHNSFKFAIDPPLLAMLTNLSAKAENLDYAHATLTEQLDLGLRGLELDLFHDPVGGLYAKPLGLEFVRNLKAAALPFDSQAMLQPGFKIMHVPDIDFRSSQPTLAGALAELRAWSVANPGRLPIIVTVNLSDDAVPIVGGTQPLPFDAEALEALDQSLIKGLGADRLITPDSVRGDHPTLERAVLTAGWPSIDAVRGKFLFVMDAGEKKRRAYLKGHPSLRGRVMFTTPAPGADDAGVMIINDPLGEEDRIRQMVQRGYLVRTRADAETREARSGDMSRFEAAKRSGAQVISTDYYKADPRLGTGYRVQFDGDPFSRQNPQVGPVGR